MVASDDAYVLSVLSVLSSRAHRLWAVKAGTRRGIGNHPRYNKGRCLDAFPFPDEPEEKIVGKLRQLGEDLDALRKRVLSEHDDLTLTRIYNVLEALRERRVLTMAERDVHDRGLISLIHKHHDEIDDLISQAYAWPANLQDEQVLERLVILNEERIIQENKGIIRWLRPEYALGTAEDDTTDSLDLQVAEPAAQMVVALWPVSLPEQVNAVHNILSMSPRPLMPQDVARAFKGKRAASMIPVLDALAGIGMARRLADGRYAA